MAADRSAASQRKSSPAGVEKIRKLEGVVGFLAERGSADERLVYERVRLGILSALSVNRTLTFTELRKLLGTSDGNLSTHARKLEDAGYVSCKKTFERGLPRTEYQITVTGRRAFKRYLDHMEALIRATREK